MRIPKPRLRQVFEHTTSFKVKKPTGQTITIAKKGLSPSTIGRLRRFAQGGEVRGYDDGGEVTEPAPVDADMATQVADVAQRALATGDTAPVVPDVQLPAVDVGAPGIVAAQPTGRRRPVRASEATAPDSAEQERQAAERAKFAAQPPPAVNLTINTAPQPAATAPQPATMTPAQPAPASVATPQKIEAAPKAVEAAEPAAPTAPAPSPTPRAAPAPVAVEPAQQISLLPELGMTPSLDLPSSQFGTPAPLAATPPAPVAVPTAQVAVPVTATPPTAKAEAATVAPAAAPVPAAVPVAPAAVQVAPVTVAAPATAATAAPVAPAAAVKPAVAAVVPATGAPPTPVPAPAAPQLPDVLTDDQIEELVGVAPPAYQPAMRMALVGQRNQQLVERQQAEQQAAAMAASERRMSDALAKVESDIAQIRQKRADIQGEIQAARDEGNVFSRMGVIEKIGTILAMGVAGFAAGYAGIPNYALQAFNQALDRDLERQRRRGDSLLNELKLVTATEEDAEQLYRGIAKEAVALEAKRAELQATTQKSRAAYGAVAGKFALDAYKEIAEVESKLATAAGQVSAGEKVALEIAKLRAREQEVLASSGMSAEKRNLAAERLRLARERLEFQQSRFAQETAIPVAETPYIIRSPTGARDIAEQISRRTSALRSVEKLQKLLHETPTAQLANVFSSERGRALAESALATERFAEGFGFKRAISLNAGKIVKEALDNPASASSLFTQFASANKRPIWLGVAAMADEMKSARKDYIKLNARADAAGIQSARNVIDALEKEDKAEVNKPEGEFGFQPAGGK